jgi:AraC-like DNA-binding protein
MTERNYGYDLMLQNHIYTLLMNVVRHWLKHGLVIQMDTADSNYDIDSITEYIDTCMGEELRVADIAAKCNMSYSNFAKKFQENYGMSCKEYIERMRIFKVEEFLLFTDHPLSYICQETGFSDCSHLIKSFKHYRGITPKQFKLSHKIPK